MNLQGEPARRQRGPDRCDFSIGLCMHLARKAITSLTTYTGSPFMALHRERKRERLEPLILERAGHSFNHGLMIESTIRIGRNVRRLSWIGPNLTVDEIQFFRKVVVRRELTIPNRPGG